MAKYQEFKIPNWSHGYNSTLPPSLLDKASLSFGSSNLRVMSRGFLRKRGGFHKALTDAGSAWNTYEETLGLFEFNDPGDKRTLVRLARDSASTNIRMQWAAANLPTTLSNFTAFGTTIASTATAGCYFQATSYLGRLYLACKAMTAPSYLAYAAGFTNNALTTSGTARTMNKPTGIELWYDRLWVYCDESVESGSYLLWTDVAGTTFDLDANYLYIPGDGPITGIKRLGSRLLVFKYRRVFILSGGEDPENLLRIDEVPFSEKDGCVAPRSLVEAEGMVYFLGDKGFYRTDGNGVQRVSDNIFAEVSLIIKNKFSEVCVVHNKKQNELCWFLPVNNEDFLGLGWGNSPWGSYFWGGGTVVNIGMAFNYDIGVWSAPFSNQPFDNACVVTNEMTSTAMAEQIIVVASNSGDEHIYIWDDGAVDDTDGMVASLVTPPLDMNSQGTVKILRKAYARVSSYGGDDIPLNFIMTGYDEYGPVVSATPKATAEFSQDGGTESLPNSQQTRLDLSFGGKNPRIKFSDVLDADDDQEGGWNLDELCFLFSVKGVRS